MIRPVFQDSLPKRRDGTAGKGKCDLVLTSMPSAEREGNLAAQQTQHLLTKWLMSSLLQEVRVGELADPQKGPKI